MELWLREVLQHLPPRIGKDVTAFQEKGEFISFAGTRGDGGKISLFGLEAEARRLGVVVEEEEEGGLSHKQDKAGKDEEGRLSHKQDKAGKEDDQGYFRLRKWLSEAYVEFEGRGDAGDALSGPENLILVESAGEALNLLLRSWVKPGEVVLVETPASPEALMVIQRNGAIPIHVACDRDGMLPDAVRGMIGEYKPALIYVTPQYSNPSGSLWSLERRVVLLELCKENGLIVVEDDSAGAIPFLPLGRSTNHNERTEVVRSIYELSQKQVGQVGDLSADVISIGSFEGTAFPTLSLAWIRGEREKIRDLLDVKSMEQASPELTGKARSLQTLLTSPAFSWSNYAAQLDVEYTARRKLMLKLLRDLAWKGTEVRDPEGGVFLWVRLPEGLCAEALLRAALLQGVAFMPGGRCYASGPDDAWLRLNFAAHAEARLRKGVGVIGAAITEFTARFAD